MLKYGTKKCSSDDSTSTRSKNNVIIYPHEALTLIFILSKIPFALRFEPETFCNYWKNIQNFASATQAR